MSTVSGLGRRAYVPRPFAPAASERVARGTGGRLWLLACVVAFLALCWFLSPFVTDDAWISARYATSLADGFGFVWNPGGPRVEGFSNPLLVGIEALAQVLGASGIDGARALGLGCGVGLLMVIHRLGPAVVGVSATRVALGVTAFCPSLALWAVGGLETLPAALVITTAVLWLSRPDAGRGHALRAGAVLALLPWLRPEGVVVALAIAGVAEGSCLLRRRGRRAGLARLGLAAGIPLVSQLVLEAVRLSVYGHLLPNSVLYKSGAGGPFDVLVKFAAQATPIIAVAALGLIVARGRQRLLAVAPVVYALGSIGTLDSVNAFSRFFLPTWPQLALLAGLAIAAVQLRFAKRGPTVAAAATAALILGASLLVATRAFAVEYSSCQQASRMQAAAWLRGNTPRDVVFSISDSGLVPAQAGGRTAIDQFLLNEPAIQKTGPLSVRRRVDMTYARRPGVIVLASKDARRFRGFYDTDRQMQRDPRLARYRLATVTRGSGKGCGYHLFVYRLASTGA